MNNFSKFNISNSNSKFNISNSKFNISNSKFNISNSKCHIIIVIIIDKAIFFVKNTFE